MALSGSIESGAYNASDGTRTLVLAWSVVSQDITGNYSDVYWEFRGGGTSAQGIYSKNNQCIVNGSHSGVLWATKQKLYNGTVIKSGTTRVYHNADGTATFSANLSGYIYNYGDEKTANGSWELDPIPRKSTPTLNASLFTLTQENTNFMRIYTNRKSSSFTHHIYFSINGGSEEGITSGVGDYYDWYFPDTLASSMPNNEKVSGYIRLYTFNGDTNIGSDTIGFEMQVDESFTPTAVITLSDQEGYLEQYGKYIQSQSKIQVSIDAEGIYGSTIKSYRTTVDGKTYTEAEFVTDVIAGKDSLNVVTVVTDTRNRSITIEQTLDVYEYAKPKIIDFKAKRCQEHNVNELGEDFLGVIFSSEVTSLNEQNTAVYELEYKKTTEDTYTTRRLDDYVNQYEVNGNAIFAADNDAYNIILRITDDFGSVEKKINGPSISVLVSKLKYNLGLAFGKLAELSGVLDIGFKTRFFGGILQKVLEEGSDLNEQKTPNTLTLKDIGYAEYLNLPDGITEGTGALTVVECGENVICQILRAFNAGKTMNYERYFYDDEWHKWVSELDKKHPIGSIYESEVYEDPGELFGGEWEQLKDRVLLGAGNTYSAGTTGGSSTHTHNDGTLVALIGSGLSDPNSLAFVASQRQTMEGSTYKVNGASYSDGGARSHNTAVIGETGASSSMPPYFVVYMWKRIA